MTVIYQQLISSLLLILLISSSSYATDDLVSFCFQPSTQLAEAQKSLEFLLLPREQVFPRPADHCFDVSTSTDRTKLLEKFLRKRYTLVAETGVSLEVEDLSRQNCQIELKTIRKQNVTSSQASIGIKTGISSGSREQNEVSTSQLLLGMGKPGTLDLLGRSLSVECRGGHRGIYQLVFSYSEQWRSKVSSEVSVKQGEVVNVGSITNELDNKSKMLGLPETIYQVSKGSENISYELQIK